MSIKGEILKKPEEIATTSRDRAKKFKEKSINKLDKQSYLQNGWRFVSESKYKARIRKNKTKDELFEDRIWLLFKDLGFDQLNKDRKCELIYRSGIPKQVDVLARDDQNKQTFVIDCSFSENKDPINSRSKLKEWSGDYEDIKYSCKKYWYTGRTNLLVVISSRKKRKIDCNYAEDKKHLFFWSLNDVEYLENLVKQSGKIARNQLYSFIFPNRKQNSLEKEYLALRGKIISGTFYSFLIPAKDLINYAYIHHRELRDISKASQAYQRMLQTKKLKAIKKYIDEIEGSFPNTIILNFTKQIRWKKGKTTSRDIEMGLITLPPYFGSAWVIDGQHRLYGAAMADNNTLLPVLAFENLDEKEQAELFVDINQKQTKVSGNLLWDLYSDIYSDSKDPLQRHQFQISEIAKSMHQSGPLKGLIEIPSLPSSAKEKLKLNTVCTTIEKFSPWSLLIPKDESKTIEYLSHIFNAFYEALRNLWIEDWEKAGKGTLLSNSGFGVFMMVFNDIIKHIAYKEKENLFRSSNLDNFKKEIINYLTLPIQELQMKPTLQKSIKSNSARGPQNDNAKIIDNLIKTVIEDFNPTRLEDFADDEVIIEKTLENKVNKAEKIFRDYVLNQLILGFGDRWWKIGLPGNIKSKLDIKWSKKIQKNPELITEKEKNKRKFEELEIGQLYEIIVYLENWKEIFGDTFQSKQELQNRVIAISDLRAMYKHSKRFEKQIFLDGKSGLNWLSNALGIKEISPSYEEK